MHLTVFPSFLPTPHHRRFTVSLSLSLSLSLSPSLSPSLSLIIYTQFPSSGTKKKKNGDPPKKYRTNYEVDSAAAAAAAAAAASAAAVRTRIFFDGLRRTNPEQQQTPVGPDWDPTPSRLVRSYEPAAVQEKRLPSRIRTPAAGPLK